MNKYRIFEGNTIQEAIRKMRAALGGNAFILAQRQVKSSGLSGLIGKQVWQITACGPEPAMFKPASGAAPKPSVPKPPPPKTALPAEPVFKARPAVPRGLPAPKFDFTVDDPVGPGAPPPPVEPYELPPAAIKSGVPGAKNAERTNKPGPERADRPGDSMNQDLLNEIRALSRRLSDAQDRKPFRQMPVFPGCLNALYENLITRDVPEQLAIDLMSQLCEKTLLDLSARDKVEESLLELLSARIRTTELENTGPRRGPKCLIFVGPTGVGKTTTLAKIATLAARDEKKKVAMITVDNLRISAAEQLQTYASLIGAPFELALSETDLAAAVSRHPDKDLILIDTPGLGPYDTAGYSELERMIDLLRSGDSGVKSRAVAPLVTLSAAAKTSDYLKMASVYKSLEPAGLVLTKLDETSSPGTFLCLMRETSWPILFCTTGQDVPEDIEPANPRRLARRILTP